jgi:thiol-disulfide isomerase/thioredoxin
MSALDILHIVSLEHFDQLRDSEDALLVYFSHEECNVCKVLKPKIRAILDEHFPKVKMSYADTVKYPEIAGQLSVFTVPTILVYFGGKEYIRVSRNIGVQALAKQIERPYGMMFD